MALIRLPPNTTHALQPLDVGIFSPLKQTWKTCLRSWYRQSKFTQVTKAIFPTVLKLLWKEMNSSNIVCGFRGSGLYPLDVNKPLSKIIGRLDESEQNLQKQMDSPGITCIKTMILNTLAPQQLLSVQHALKNGKAKKRKIPNNYGEVLTEDEALARLFDSREAKTSRLSKEKMNIDNGKSCENRSPYETVKINGDGNCLFSCLAKAIMGNNDEVTINYVRMKAASYVFENWANHEETVKVVHGKSSALDYFDFMSKSGTYGDCTEVLALSQVFGCCIEVYRSNCNEVNSNDIFNAEKRGLTVRLHLHNEHYDLIHKVKNNTLAQSVSGQSRYGRHRKRNMKYE